MRPLHVAKFSIASIVAIVASSGCALTSNAPPLDVTYYTIDVPRTTTTRSAGGPVAAPRALALGRVRASAFLRNRIVYRDENDALGAYERWRWTEYPDVYLRRSLSHAVFDDERFVETLAGNAPTLEAELVAFEEIRRGTARAGRVQVEYRVRVGNRVLASDVVTVERPASSEGGIAPLVDSLEAALDEVTARIAASVHTGFGTAAETSTPRPW